jgi:hypothetical protein
MCTFGFDYSITSCLLNYSKTLRQRLLTLQSFSDGARTSPLCSLAGPPLAEKTHLLTQFIRFRLFKYSNNALSNGVLVSNNT